MKDTAMNIDMEPVHQEPGPAAGACRPGHRRSLPLGLRLIWLSYLLLYFIPWWFEPPSIAMIVASLAGIVVFLPLYLLTFDVCGWRQLGLAAGILAIGFMLEPFHGMWTVFAVYAAASVGHARPARLGILGVSVVALTTTAFGLALHLPLMSWVWGAFLAVILGTAALLAADMKAREEQLAMAREDARRYAVLAERERIARDLHDVLGHTMTLVAVKADLAKRLMDTDPESALREVDEIHAAARASLGEIRAAVTGMRSTTLAAELVEARRTLESAGVALESTSPAEPLPPPVETALATIIREAATNVVRHSRAQHCRIHLWREGSTVRLAIQDNGRGGLPVEGQGITGMRQRLAALRGSLEVRGESGFRIEAFVPLDPSAQSSPEEVSVTPASAGEETVP
jgi:two-component system sensor histidine kinase DesK